MAKNFTEYSLLYAMHAVNLEQEYEGIKKDLELYA